MRVNGEVIGYNPEEARGTFAIFGKDPQELVRFSLSDLPANLVAGLDEITAPFKRKNHPSIAVVESDQIRRNAIGFLRGRRFLFDIEPRENRTCRLVRGSVDELPRLHRADKQPAGDRQRRETRSVGDSSQFRATPRYDNRSTRIPRVLVYVPPSGSISPGPIEEEARLIRKAAQVFGVSSLGRPGTTKKPVHKNSSVVRAAKALDRLTRGDVAREKSKFRPQATQMVSAPPPTAALPPGPPTEVVTVTAEVETYDPIRENGFMRPLTCCPVKKIYFRSNRFPLEVQLQLRAANAEIAKATASAIANEIEHATRAASEMVLGKRFIFDLELRDRNRTKIVPRTMRDLPLDWNIMQDD